MIVITQAWFMTRFKAILKRYILGNATAVEIKELYLALRKVECDHRHVYLGSHYWRETLLPKVISELFKKIALPNEYFYSATWNVFLLIRSTCDIDCISKDIYARVLYSLRNICVTPIQNTACIIDDLDYSWCEAGEVLTDEFDTPYRVTSP